MLKNLDVFNIFLFIHIFGGMIGLIAGLVNVIRKKGDRKHRIAGKFFFWGMMTAGCTAFILSILHPSMFLFMVGVFTVYMVASGQRYLSLKKLHSGQQMQLPDWLLCGIMLLFGFGLAGYGIFYLAKGSSFGIVMVVFGGIGLMMALEDIRNFRGKSAFENVWLLMHLQRMTGGFIAALTAFLVVNMRIEFIPSFVAWLLPTVLITPLIFKWSKKYGKKVKE